MGIVAIKLPDIGEGIAEAELVTLYVKIGDLIAEDEVIADVMTDKATVEVPSSRSGRVAWIGGAVGDTLAIGADLIRLEVDGEGKVAPAEPKQERAPEPDPSATTPPEKPVKEQKSASPAPLPVHRPAACQERAEGTRPLAAPSVRKAALERGIDLRLVPGSGPAGRILPADLDAFVPGVPVPPPGSASGSGAGRRTGQSETRIIGLRKRIAERMEAAKARAPHITIVEEVDVTELDLLRRKLNDGKSSVKLTVLPFVMRALVRAVEDWPEMNAHFDDTQNTMTTFQAVHIGIATQTDAGLMVPVVRHAEALGLSETAKELARLARAGRDGTARSEELSGSTITISSLGPLGGVMTTPILNRPEVAIIGINKIAKRPLWNGDEFVPRDVMNVSCSFDHRVIDGWNAAQFIQCLRELLETPALQFVEV